MPVPFKNTTTGEIETYPDLDAAQSAALLSSRPELRPAIPDEVSAAATYRKHSTALEQLKAAGELGVGVASFGQIASDSPEAEARRGAFRQESPVLSTVVEQGAALVPAAAAAALTGGLGAAAGLSAAQAGAAAFAAESVTMGAAVEAELAREEQRDISIESIIQGLALDVFTAGLGRGVRGFTRRGSRAAENAAEGALSGEARVATRAVDDLEELADSPATAVARGNRISKERRQANSVGARSANDPKPPPPEKAEIQDYARNRDAIDADVDELGYNAINDAIGGDTPAFDAVHNISLKKGDVLGRMQDANQEGVLDFSITQSERAELLAQKLEADGAKQAAAAVREHVQRLANAWESDRFVEDTALALDQMKRTLDRYRTRYGASGTKASDPLRERVQWLDDVLDAGDQPLRKGLEDRSTWGKLWADKQLEENRLWSGSDGSQLSGLINTSKVWQRAFAEPHSGIRVRRGLDEVPVFKSKGELVKLAKSMNARDFDETMNAFDTWVDKARQMNQLKAELGVDSINHTPIARLETALSRMEALSVELKQIRKLEAASEPLRKHLEKMGEGKAFAQVAYEGAQNIPGVGRALKLGEQIPGVREKISNFLEPEPGVYRERPSVDEAVSNVKARQQMRREGWKSERAMSAKERAQEYMRRKQHSPKRDPDPPAPTSPRGRASERGMVELGTMSGPKKKAGAADAERFAQSGLVGKSLSDLGAIPFEKGETDAALDFLRNDPHFRETGNVKDNFGSSPGGLPQITIWTENGAERIGLSNGRHRLTVAQELGMPTIIARVRKMGAKGGEHWEYVGPVRVTDTGTSGFTDAGRTIAGVAASPMGVVTGLGAAGIGLKSAIDLEPEDTPMTDALAELADHSRAIMDRAAQGLLMPDSRPARLPSVGDRFKGDAPDMRTAFANILETLQTAHNDPATFIEAMSEAYGDMGAGGHDDLAQRVIARTAVAVQYLLNNLPPNIANSVTRPEGAPTDLLAISEFAKLWSGAMRPGDVIYDVGTGRVTPTQIRALREVHPDIYTNLRVAVVRALGDARSVPFETKRQLDNLFDIDGAAGASFSSTFGKTMATARADKQQPSQSLGGESVLAPQTATKIFSTGPSAIR